MASLTGQSIASSYEQLLQVDRDGGGNGSTLVDIKDGDNGTTFALQIATDKIQVNGNATITTTDTSDNLTLISTDDGASAAPNLRLYRNSPNPADSDIFGQIDFDGRNTNSQDFVGARIKVASGDVSDGSEAAQIEFDVMTAGTLREYMRMASGSTPAVIFNQDSRDIDFRVLSDNLDPAFFVQGSDGAVGIGTGSPANVIHLKCATPVMRWEHTTNGILGYLGDTSNFLTPDSPGADSFGWRSEGDIRLGTGGNNLALIIDSSQDSKFYGKVEVNGYGLTLVRSAPVIEFNDTDESGSGDGGGKFKIASDNDRLGFFGRADNDSTWNERVYLTRAGDILPATDDAHDLGSSSNRFDDVYATNGTIQTSDERLKDNITDSSLGLDFLNALRPVEYQWKDYSYDIEKEESVEAQDAVYETVVVQKAVDAKDAVMGTRQKTISKEVEKTRTEIVEEDGKYVQKETSYTETVEELQYEEVDLYNKDGEVIGSHTIPIMEEYEVEPAIKAKDAVMETKEKTFARTHFGLIAQEVEQVLKDSSLTNNDFAGLIYDEDADRYGMRYHELIAPLIKAVQELSKKVTDLENK